MTTVAYTNYTNGSVSFGRGYQPGDTLIEGWTGVVDVDTNWVSEVGALADQVFAIHNVDDRPDGQLCPSMSVGDVIVFGEIAVTVESVGFAVCSIDLDDIITNQTYRQWAGLR